MIAVTGPSGQLGGELVSQGCVPLRGRLGSEQMLSEIERIDPDVIINTAAMTDVDRCQHELLMAASVNAWGPEWLGSKFGGHLIQISTDYIFDGQCGPYGVRDSPSPTGVYGWSKLGGEVALGRRRAMTLIVRTTVLFSHTSNNFVTKLVKQLSKGDFVNLYNFGLRGTPTYTPSLATEIIRMADEDYTGLAHVAGDRVVTRLEFARDIARIFGYDPKLIRAIEQRAPGAPRPKRAGLICDHDGYRPVMSHDYVSGLELLSMNNGVRNQ